MKSLHPALRNIRGAWLNKRFFEPVCRLPVYIGHICAQAIFDVDLEPLCIACELAPKWGIGVREKSPRRAGAVWGRGPRPCSARSARRCLYSPYT